ncbi:PREDICTED: sex peptide receptor-like, partial [Rhagoletis zephyria]|uniref:sex peptide receptor-like n=1 Tax=Rhagoletis zephyria TaxID=28612 RepID=UPI0008113D60
VDYYIGEDVYYLYYYIFRIIFVHICPCSALVLLNVLLFRALSRTAATRERLFAGALAAAAAARAGATTGGTTSNTHDGNATSFYSAFGVTSHSKASPPYSNCLMTPMTMRNSVTTTNSTVVTANGQSKTGATVSISASKRDANSTTIMLIVIVSMFLLLEIPLTITTILHVVQNVTSVSLVDYNTLNTIILITNFFIILSYPINFAIYCGMSRQFRTTFSELFLHDGRSTGVCR